jgi:hypothetical protein
MLFILPSESDNVQAVNLLEVTDIGGPDPITELKSRDSNRQIRERDADTLGLAQAIDPSGPDRDPDCYGLDWHAGQQFVEEPLASIAALGGIGSTDPVRKFKHGNHRDSDFVVAGSAGCVFEKLAGVLALALSGYGRRRIEHQSHWGGSRASR